MALFGSAAPVACMAQRKKCKIRAKGVIMDDMCAAPEPIKPVIRKEFPETWIWDTIQGTR